MSAAVVGALWAPCLADEGKSGGEPPKHTNRLLGTLSPYLLQHAHNPVDWYPWGDEAFARAKQEDKPIFLSIGYAACHWCHVMAHQSFENEGIAKILNEHFIAIKVDREERPDIDEIYMAATVAQTGRGGWPMSVFMTPEKQPFLCGTYFPPEDGRGRRGFRGLCLELANKWKSDRDALIADASSLVRTVASRKRVGGGQSIPDRANVSRVVESIASGFDPVLGGRRSGRNKFPPTMAMELMLREYATQKEVSKPQLLDLVETTLTRMARGGIYDQIGGGICRYSVDPHWKVPHFEKMLYDQATVSGVYLSAYQLTGQEKYARTARSILDYCLADLQHEGGAFYSSRDADSEGEEGKFYVWERKEIDDLFEPRDASLFSEYYNVTARGNFEHGRSILHITTSDEAFLAKHNLTASEWEGRLATMKHKLFEVRSHRVHPGLDDKILAEWNGLLITQLARAGRILNEPRYVEAAARAADFILKNMMIDGRLHRAHRKGKTHVAANAADHTAVVEALITLYETTFEARWLTNAVQLNDRFIEHFRDSAGGGFFYTADDAEALVVRSKNLRDSVVPSANSTAVLNLLRLAILLGKDEYRVLAEDTMREFQRQLSGRQLARMLWAVLFYHDHPKEIAIIGQVNDPATQALVAEVYRHYLPNKVVTVATPEAAAKPNASPLIRRKTLVKGKPGAYVCRNYVCGRPVTTAKDLAEQLEVP